MGCDIHVHLEYKEGGRWDGTPQFRIPRNYGLFAALAGVRKYNSEVESFLPRGVPNEVSTETREDYTLWVSDTAGDDEDNCTREQAENYVKYGSRYWDSKKTRVIHPDWHSASWLSLNEFKIAYDRFLAYFKQSVLPDITKFKDDHEGYLKELERTKDMREPVSIIPEVEALIAYLEVFRNRGYDTRVIFWFDN